MQTTSATWAALYAAGAPMEVRVEIGGTVYAETSAPVISRAAMPDSLSVGNVVSASLLLSVRTGATIARSAGVAVSMRLNDGETASEWLPAGTFYISRRARDPVTGLLALECYDALLKANAIWEPSGGTWPRSMSSVVSEFLTLLGVSLDSRTAMPSGASYVVSEPAEGTTIRDVLAMIGQAGGGNWVITPGNKLRLVPLVSAAGAAEAEDGAVDVSGVVGNIDVSGSGTITGIRDTWEDEVTLTGTDSGIVVDVELPPVTAAEMSDALLGQSYQAYSLTGAIYDPAAELGDYVRAGASGEIASVLYSERVTLGPAFRGDIGAPEAGELSDEYPYIGANARTLALARASVREAVETLDDELDQQEIFNRLTDNGAAQGLVLYNGQLYINANYINAGTISGDRINGGTLIVGGSGNVDGVIQVNDSSGQKNIELSNGGIDITNNNNTITTKGYWNNSTIQTPYYPASYVGDIIFSNYIQSNTEKRRAYIAPIEIGLDYLINNQYPINQARLSLNGVQVSEKIINGSSLEIVKEFLVDLYAHKMSFTGDAQINGALNLGDNLYINRVGAVVYLKDPNQSSTAAGLQTFVYNNQNRLQLQLRAIGSSGIELYQLPVPDTHGSNTVYRILTTKNAATASSGTGQTDVTSFSSISDIADAASGFTITAAAVKMWGYVVMLYIRIHKTAAGSSGSFVKVCNVKSGKRPNMLTAVMGTDSGFLKGYMNSDGDLYVDATWTANVDRALTATYIIVE